MTSSESGPKKSFFRTLLRVGASLLLGLLVGVLAHYLLYRFSLPSKPFIYVAF
jgi:hypothetical protein